MVGDMISGLENLAVTICYAPRMDHDALWLPDDRLVILNAAQPRQVLCSAVADLMPAIYEFVAQNGFPF